MEIRKEKKDSALSLAIEGRIDTTTAPRLETELKTDLDGVTELRLDFGQVEYISSAGLRVLLSAQKLSGQIEAEARAKAEKLVADGAAEDVVRLEIEKLVRAYDPCLSCSVH